MYNNSPSYFNLIRPKSSLTSKLFSSSSIKSIDSIITGAQKIVDIYNKAAPIIEQTRPMINNLKTTFKVARAFKKFSNDNSLEKAFDDLPDYQDNQEVKKVTNPFYP